MNRLKKNKLLELFTYQLVKFKFQRIIFSIAKALYSENMVPEEDELLFILFNQGKRSEIIFCENPNDFNF